MRIANPLNLLSHRVCELTMNLNERQYEYVYLLRTREFIRLDENVFKIGRTSKLKQRFKQYPKSSELIRFKMVRDSVWVEQKIKELFTEKFILKREYGLEWFEGDPNLMSLAFEEIACKYEHEFSDLRKQSMKEIPTNISSETNNKMQTCECGITCVNRSSLKRHQSSKVHEMYMQCAGEIMTPDENGMYTCNICNVSTLHRGNYRKHITSAKHVTERDRMASAAAVAAPNPVENTMVMQLISAMMNQQQELQKQQHEFQKQQHEFQMNMVNKFVSRDRDTEHSTVSTLDHSIQNTTTTTNSHNTTTNTKFNLNLFLNEDCKNAMNPDEPRQTRRVLSWQ